MLIKQFYSLLFLISQTISKISKRLQLTTMLRCLFCEHEQKTRNHLCSPSVVHYITHKLISSYHTTHMYTNWSRVLIFRWSEYLQHRRNPQLLHVGFSSVLQCVSKEGGVALSKACIRLFWPSTSPLSPYKGRHELSFTQSLSP